MSVKPLTEQHLEFLSLKEGYTGSSESTHIKMPHCWKSHVTAHIEESTGLSEVIPSGNGIGEMIMYSRKLNTFCDHDSKFRL